MLVGAHGAHQEKLALLLLSARASWCGTPTCDRPARTRSATVVPDGCRSWRSLRRAGFWHGRCNADSHAYEMVALLWPARVQHRVSLRERADSLHGVQQQVLDALQASVGRHVSGVIAVTGCTMSVATLWDVAMAGSRPVVMDALGVDPGVILQAVGV